MKSLYTVFLLLMVMPNAQAQELCAIVNGATLLAQDGENSFLGKIDNKFASESIFNDYGTYGSKFSGSSIWNEFGTFGGKFSSYSPFNQFTSTPPMIVKDGQVIGYLTANKSIQNSVTPNLLRAMCGE